ncbi:MAG: FAD-dependent thymidylate synthase [Thermostichus sp. DG_1_6_bins_120]
MDSLFQVVVLNQTPDPERVVYQAMHQDYSPEFVTPEERLPERYGEAVVRHLLEGNRGHYGPLEHPQITFAVGYFPHTVMQQARTHRVGVSFDVQCLAGDTEVTFVRSSGGLRKIKIAQLYDLWANGEKAIRERKLRGCQGEPPATYRRDCKTRLQKMRLRVLNEDIGLFETGHLQNVMCSGLQPVYRLTLANGKTLDCTVNHRLYTSQGWQRMGDALGLVVDNTHQVLAITKTCKLMTNGVVCPDALYNQKPWLKAHPVGVVSVEYLGMQTTYDLEVEGPWHNFVANGVVVHNSFRYTGQQIAAVGQALFWGKAADVEQLFYVPQTVKEGKAKTRQGVKTLSPEALEIILEQYRNQAIAYYRLTEECGVPYEDARNIIGYGIRQHFVVSFNCRSLMHFLDLRAKEDAQLEIRQLCELIWPHFQAWCPHIAAWYKENRWGKARLAP